MKRILKYKNYFLAIGLILSFTFTQRLLDNQWADYVGQTLITIGLNMKFFCDKREDGKIGFYNTIAILFITGLWLSLTYFIIKDYLL